MAAILVSRNPQQNSETEIEADFCASNLWEAWDWIKKCG